jgi:uncharacterized protein YjbI with pentapeptide repeats
LTHRRLTEVHAWGHNEGIATFANAHFEYAHFKGALRFANATFQNYTTFVYATFGVTEKSVLNPTEKDRPSIGHEADFSAIKVDRAFDMDGAAFENVPDFKQADFNQAPILTL